MIPLTAAVAVSLVNLAFAAKVYLSLRGWLVADEPSGMQLIFHLLVTAPVVVLTSFWLLCLPRTSKSDHMIWKVNTAGILIPVISMQTGVTHYGYDRIGLLVIFLVAAGLLLLYGKRVGQFARS